MIELRERIREMLLETGASEVGFAQNSIISDSEITQFNRWIERKMHSGMDYMNKHLDIRKDPSLLLTDTHTIISLAFPYLSPVLRDKSLPTVARYAYGEDYHDVIRKRLKPICKILEKEFDCKTRICIDSAPIFERFWALKAGIGFSGKNRCVITRMHGSYIFLAEILTTLQLPPDKESTTKCVGCDACIKSCPTGALTIEGINASKCLSYLTIEHKGTFPDISKEALKTPAGKNCLFGCDICQQVCPHNTHARPTRIQEFYPSQKILSLSKETLTSITGEQLKAEFKGSPLARSSFAHLKS